MDRELAGNIFDDRRIARRVGDCQVADAGLAVGEDRSDNRERLLAEAPTASGGDGVSPGRPPGPMDGVTGGYREGEAPLARFK